MATQTVYPATHIIVGTKAQFIKMAPIARLLEERGWPYRVLDLGQHGSITPGIVRDFGLQPDQIHVIPWDSTVASYGQALRWAGALVARIASPRKRLTRDLLMRPAGHALIHGDTLSTLFGLHLARRLGLRVGLVEAGLSSGNCLDPFPEEMIRRHVEKRADFLFAPDHASADCLKERGLKGKVINTEYNTGRDALLLIASLHAEKTRSVPTFRTVLTLHRAETISHMGRLCSIMNHVIGLAPNIGPIRFYLHEPTRRALVRGRLMKQLQDSEHFQLCPLGSYPEFTGDLVRAKYILTDGGSIQEEASYINKRCLILRRRTERGHGLGETAMLASMNIESDLQFLLDDERTANRDSQWVATLKAPARILQALYPAGSVTTPSALDTAALGHD